MERFILEFYLTGGRLLTSDSAGDVSSVCRTAEQWWRMEMETHTFIITLIYWGITSLVSRSIAGYSTGARHFMVAAFSCPQQAGAMFDGKWNKMHLYISRVDGRGLFEELIGTHSSKCTYFMLHNYRKDISSAFFLSLFMLLLVVISTC